MNKNKKLITYITESNIDYVDAFLSDRFILLNMYKEGIWLVDKEHSQWQKIKEIGLCLAKMFNDKETIEKLESIDN